jgi:hypothetical protein
MHPILATLKNTRSEYLLELLYAFNKGDMDTFSRVKSSTDFNAQVFLGVLIQTVPARFRTFLFAAEALYNDAHPSRFFPIKD